MGWMNAPFAGSAWATNADAGIAINAAMGHAFGAIAYSPSTGRWGTSYGHDDEASAERTALSYCGARDAAVLVWARAMFLALARADDGSFGWAWNARAKDAEKLALKGCHGPNPKILVLFHSRNG